MNRVSLRTGRQQFHALWNPCCCLLPPSGHLSHLFIYSYILFGSPASRGPKCQDFFSPTWTLYIPQNVSLITIPSFLINFLSSLYCLHPRSTCSVGSCSWQYSHNPLGCALFKLFCVEVACLSCVCVGSPQEDGYLLHSKYINLRECHLGCCNGALNLVYHYVA